MVVMCNFCLILQVLYLVTCAYRPIERARLSFIKVKGRWRSWYGRLRAGVPLITANVPGFSLSRPTTRGDERRVMPAAQAQGEEAHVVNKNKRFRKDKRVTLSCLLVPSQAC
jgi:hypothetical protein